MKLEIFKGKNMKKTGIIIFIICCVFMIVGVFFYQSFAFFEMKENFHFIEGQVQEPGGLYFAYYIDNEVADKIPSKGTNYTLSSKSNCNNGVTVSWDQENWITIVNYSNFKIENNSRTKCTLYFEKTTFSQIVTTCGNSGDAASICITKYKEMENSLMDDGTKDHNLRYIGANPDNYVLFNDELWRIIGVMNNVDGEGVFNKSRIKIVRNDSIGNYSWDTSASNVNSGRGVNDWSQSDAMRLMNKGYENYVTSGSLYWNRKGGQCYTDINNTKTSCSFTNNGLTDGAKTLIDVAGWYASGIQVTDLILNLYESERSTTKAPWKGQVGLMYPSDYGFATSGGSTSDRKTCLGIPLNSWNDYEDCYANNWISMGKNIWTISPISGIETKVAKISSNGSIDEVPLYKNQADFFPTVYLKASVKIISGYGSEEKPFILSVQ